MSFQIELRQIRYFLALAETLHFGRAADNLQIAQPYLSLQIRKIEQALGHALFIRTTRGVTLTPAGAFLASRVEDLQANFDQTIRTTQRIGQGEEGTLSIGFSGSAMYGRLPFVLDRFRRLYPKVRMQLREVDPEEMPLLLDGTLDVGFIRDGAPTQGLRMIPLSREYFYAVFPQSHKLAKNRGPVAPGELIGEKFLLFSPRIARLAFERVLAACTSDSFTPDVSLEAPQWITIVSLVAAGMGVSVIPESFARLNIPGAAFRPLRSKAWSSIDLWTENSVRNPAAAHLLAIAKEEFGRSSPKQFLK